MTLVLQEVYFKDLTGLFIIPSCCESPSLKPHAVRPLLHSVKYAFMCVLRNVLLENLGLVPFIWMQP